MTKQEIQQFVYDFLFDRGLPHITICAIMGNITGESAWNPNIIEEGSGIGFGLCQWSFERREQLEEYGTDLMSQCEFLWCELTGDDPFGDIGAEYQWISNPSDSVDNGEGFSCSNEKFLSGDGTLEFLTKAFCYCWERPAYATNHLKSTRIPSAKEFYKTMRHTDSEENDTIINDAIAWAIEIAEDDSHGYDQNERWGPDYDCSSFVITAYEEAGCPVASDGASYTGDMIEVFEDNGFLKLTYWNGMPLSAGDVLWRTGHTELYIGNGQRVGAHISENGTVYADEEGDQTGNEISVVNFSPDESWEYVLRLPSTSSGGNGEIVAPKVKRKGFNFVLFGKARQNAWKRRIF